MTAPSMRRGLAALAALSAAGVALAACSGDNLFRSGEGVEPGRDRNAPAVEVAAPVAGSIVALGDTVRVMARITDNRALATVEFQGYALKGDPHLGTQQKVARFETKTVKLSGGTRAVTDTTLLRDLGPANGDTLPERQVYVVVTARDTAGNAAADTVLISLGGPKLRITTPTADSAFRAGTAVTVRVSAEDRGDRVSSVRVRTTGAFARDTTLRLPSPLAVVDTVVVFPIPNGVQGDLTIDATATSTQRVEGMARPVRIRVTPAAADAVAPRVSFSAVVPPRVETTDTVSVTVTAVDEARVDSLGTTVLVLRRNGSRQDTVGVLTQRVGVAPPTGTHTFRLPLAGLGLSGLDTLTTTVEVVAFAKDGAGNCATATAPNTVQSLPCRTGFRGATVSDAPGAVSTAFVVRGRTVLPPAPGDTLADLVSDRRRVFASNRSRNQVEVLPVGSQQYGAPILVGSRPWGLAFSPDTGTLLVANSGGAGSISRVSITPTSVPTSEDRARRIVTENVVVYVVRFRIDPESGRINLDIDHREYSDLPRYLAQTAAGHILYATIPTQAAPGGTVQDYDPRGVEPVTDVFVEYARASVSADQFVIRRADVVERIIQGSGESSTHQLRVCDHAPGGTRGSVCFPQNPGDRMTFQAIEQSLRAAGSDVIFDYAVDPELIPLSDTTFLATSRDHRTVAVGEGARAVGRVLSFAEDAGGTVRMIGDTRDLVDNASDRVVGLALNPDGSVGAARGNSTYFFNRSLRKLGDRVVTGNPTGGLALHPAHDQQNPATALAFVSGLDAQGRPVIDVVDTFHFRVLRRIYIRDAVVGALIAVPTGAASGVTIRLYGLTRSGIVAVELTAADLQ